MRKLLSVAALAATLGIAVPASADVAGSGCNSTRPVGHQLTHAHRLNPLAWGCTSIRIDAGTGRVRRCDWTVDVNGHFLLPYACRWL